MTEALATLAGLQVGATIYLALALSKLRERIARIEGRHDEREERLHRR